MLKLRSALNASSLLSVLLLSLWVSSSSAETWVVTDLAHPVEASAEIRTIYLDAPERLEERLTGDLPNDPAVASRIVEERMHSPEWQDVSKELALAYQGVADAWSLGVSKIPAVVVDKKYVVYGQSDVAKAVSLIAQHRGGS